MDYLTIGSSPCEEDCAQVGTEDYRRRSILESNAFIQLIRDSLGLEPTGAKLGIKWFPHDFGSYSEVVVHYNETMEDAVEYAYKVEGNCPTTWMFNGKDYSPDLGDNPHNV